MVISKLFAPKFWSSDILLTILTEINITKNITKKKNMYTSRCVEQFSYCI